MSVVGIMVIIGGGLTCMELIVFAACVLHRKGQRPQAPIQLSIWNSDEDKALTPSDRSWLESMGATEYAGATAEEARRREAARETAARQANCRHESTEDIVTFQSDIPITRWCSDCGARIPVED